MSSGPRLCLPGGFPDPPGRAELPDEEARHARSRRLRPGAEVVLIDGCGRRALGRLGITGRDVHVEALLPASGEPERRVTVLLAAAEPVRLEWAVEKGTECGAHGFVLFPAARSQEASVRRIEERTGRLRRIAVEAVKQCDRTLVPGVRWAPSFEAALAMAPPPVLLARPGAPPLSRVDGRVLSVAVGPEGGWDPSEDSLALSWGATPASLGDRVLRVETAVVALLCRLLAPDA